MAQYRGPDVKPTIEPSHLIILEPAFYPPQFVNGDHRRVIDFPYDAHHPDSFYNAFYALGRNIHARLYITQVAYDALQAGAYRLVVEPHVGMNYVANPLPSYLSIHLTFAEPNGPVNSNNGIPIVGGPQVALPVQPPWLAHPEWDNWYYVDVWLNIALDRTQLPQNDVWEDYQGSWGFALRLVPNVGSLPESPLFQNFVIYSIGLNRQPVGVFHTPPAQGDTYIFVFPLLPSSSGTPGNWNTPSFPGGNNVQAFDIPFSQRTMLPEPLATWPPPAQDVPSSPQAIHLNSFSWSSSEGSISASIELWVEGNFGVSPPPVGALVDVWSLLPPEIRTGQSVPNIPLVVDEFEEIAEYDPDTRSLRRTTWRIQASLSTEQLTRGEICCEPCIYPYDPVALALQAIEQVRTNRRTCSPNDGPRPMCLEEYLRMRKETDASRPSYEVVKQALGGVYDFSCVNTPVFGKVPFADPPDPNDELYTGKCSYADLLSRAFGWANYREFISPSGKVLLLDGPSSCLSLDLSPWGVPVRTSTTDIVPPAVSHVEISTGPIGTSVDPDTGDSPCQDDEPGTPGDSSACEGPRCVYYTIDQGPSKTVVTIVEKECGRVLSEVVRTSEDVYIDIQDVAPDAIFTTATCVAVTEERTEYRYASPTCDAPLSKTRVVYKTDIITDIPDWVLEDIVGPALCWSDKVRVRYVAEKTTTTYTYNEKGCLVEEVTRGYRASMAGVEYEEVYTGVRAKVQFAYEPVYDRHLYLHYGDGAWYYNHFTQGSKGPLVHITPTGRFLPIATARMGASESYVRSVVTNQEPPCYDCVSSTATKDKPVDEKECKLGTVSSPSVGLESKRYVEETTPPVTARDVQSISATVEMINSYWPITLNEVEAIRNALNTISTSPTPVRNPCTGDYTDTTTVEVITDTLDNLYPEEGTTPYDWQALASQVASYIKQTRSYGTRRKVIEYEGYITDGFPYTPLLAGYSVASGGLIEEVQLNIRRQQEAAGLVSFVYNVSFTILEG